MPDETVASNQPAGWRLGYVIYSPDTDEYLASVADAGPSNVLGWSVRPDDALRWEDISDAERAAHDRVEAQEAPGNRHFTVEVAELLDNADRLMVRTAAQIVPPGDHILSGTEVAMLAISNDFRAIAIDIGLDAALLRPVVGVPDRITHFVSAGATLYLRKASGMGADRHLLAIVDMRQGRPPEIIAAWPVPSSITGPSPSPLSALKALCATVGNPLMFRRRRTTLVLGERHPEIPPEFEAVVSEVGSPAAIRQMRIGCEPRTGELLIGWVYSIDHLRLLEMLESSARPGE